MLIAMDLIMLEKIWIDKAWTNMEDVKKTCHVYTSVYMHLWQMYLVENVSSVECKNVVFEKKLHTQIIFSQFEFQFIQLMVEQKKTNYA